MKFVIRSSKRFLDKSNIFHDVYAFLTLYILSPALFSRIYHLSRIFSICVNIKRNVIFNVGCSSILIRMDQRLENQQINEKFDQVIKANDLKENQQTLVILPHLFQSDKIFYVNCLVKIWEHEGIKQTHTRKVLKLKFNQSQMIQPLSF